MIEVIPAILEKDFVEIEKKIRRVEHLVGWVQIDIADGILVPNTVLPDLSKLPDVIASNAKQSRPNHPEQPDGIATLPPVARDDGLQFELHMMVKNPLEYLVKFAPFGFKRFYAHVEAEGVEDFIVKASEMDVEVGLAIDGPTSFETIHPYLDNLDCVLVMAIEAGFSGRPYRKDTAEKIRKIREVDIGIPIGVDGAMDDVNAAKVVAAGANRICSNSFIFREKNVTIPIEKLKNLGIMKQKR